MKKATFLFCIGLFVSTAQAVEIDIAGSVATSGGEFADYSTTVLNTAFAPSSVNDGTVDLLIGPGASTVWATTGYPGAGSEINFYPGANVSDDENAFTNDVYLNIDLSATQQINLDSISVSFWRNGAGAAQDYQFAYSEDATWTTDDLLGTATHFTSTGSGNTTTVSIASGLPTNFTNTSLRLYTWTGNGNTHLYNVTANYTVVPEASTFTLMGLTLLAALFLKRRFR